MQTTSELLVAARIALDDHTSMGVADRILLFPTLVARLAESQPAPPVLRNNLAVATKELNKLLSEVNGFADNANVGTELVLAIRRACQRVTTCIGDIERYNQVAQEKAPDMPGLSHST